MKVRKSDAVRIIKEEISRYNAIKLKESVDRKYFIFSYDKDDYIRTFDKFDKIRILSAIKSHLQNNPSDELEFQREFSEVDRKKFVGNEVLDQYEINPKTGKPALVIWRGNKRAYKKI